MKITIDIILALIFCCIGVFIFTPIVGIHLSFETALYMHIGSFMCLGLLYEFPEFILDLFSIYLMHNGRQFSDKKPLLKKVITTRYLLTHFSGPIFGVLTVESGMYIIHAGHHSFLEGWLFWIVVVASIFVCKGLFHHNLYTQKLYFSIVHPQNPIDEHEAQRLIDSPFDAVLNFTELPAYIFIFLADYFKPGWQNPWPDFVRMVEPNLPSHSLIGVAIFILIFIFLTPLLFWAKGKWSVC